MTIIYAMKKNFCYVTLFVSLFLFGGFTHAQFVPQSVSLSASPSSPSPGDTVTIEAATPLFDKNAALFKWTINGVERTEFSGMGKNTIILGAGKLGSALEVSVIVTRESGPGGNASLSIPVADLALMWYAETHTPKWYRGKALPIENSTIAVVALPNVMIKGSRVDPKKLIYRWSLDDQTNIETGVGKDVFRVKTSAYFKQTLHVNVVIEDTEKHIRKEQNIFLTTFKPRAVVYPYSPLGGIESRQGIGYIFSQGKSLVDFVAEIFNLPLSSPGDVRYNWKVKNAAVTGSAENPQLLTIDLDRESDAQIPLTVTIEDPKRSLPSLFYSLFLVRD